MWTWCRGGAFTVEGSPWRTKHNGEDTRGVASAKLDSNIRWWVARFKKAHGGKIALFRTSLPSSSSSSSLALHPTDPSKHSSPLPNPHLQTLPHLPHQAILFLLSFSFDFRARLGCVGCFGLWVLFAAVTLWGCGGGAKDDGHGSDSGSW